MIYYSAIFFNHNRKFFNYTSTKLSKLETNTSNFLNVVTKKCSERYNWIFPYLLFFYYKSDSVITILMTNIYALK